MTKPTRTVWDRLLEDADAATTRAEARTAAFDDLLARCRSFDAARDAYASARLGREYIRRTTYWRPRLMASLWRTDRALADSTTASCPDCGYDLIGIPDGIPAMFTGAAVGPAACPECGTPWPLVPPPVPNEVRRDPTAPGDG